MGHINIESKEDSKPAPEAKIAPASEAAQQAGERFRTQLLDHAAANQTLKSAETPNASGALSELAKTAKKAAENMPLDITEHGKSLIEQKSKTEKPSEPPSKDSGAPGKTKRGSDEVKTQEKPGAPGALEQIKPGDKFEQMNESMSAAEEFESDNDGVEELPTGDHIVRDEGKETLFTPNGDKITLNPDGTNKIKGDLRKVETDGDGVTTVQFGDGARVSFDEQGFRSISRGNQSVEFGRSLKGGGGSKGSDSDKGQGKVLPEQLLDFPPISGLEKLNSKKR